jgi:hypothetical protein
LQGGVGNQLFQLAAAIYHANLFSKELIIDFGLVSKVRHNGSTIENLKLFSEVRHKVNLALGNMPQGAEISELHSKFFRANRKLQQGLHQTLIQTSQVGFDERLEKFRNLKQVQGYFQSHHYFDEIVFSNIIKHQDFMSENLSQNSLMIKNYIEENNPVVLHIRAGDYLALSDSIGVLSGGYFATALKAYPLFKDRKFLLFTDDLSYAKSVLAEIPIEFKFFHESTNVHPLENISVMSFASDFIISNSTFSWWGAKLSGNKGNVIAPSQWFKARTQPLKLIPQNWNQIQSSFL